MKTFALGLAIVSSVGPVAAQVSIPNSVLSTIGDILPERSNAGAAYLSSVYTPNLLVDQVCTAEVIFVWEGAGYRNTLGYFTYADQPDGSIQILSRDLVFSDMSFPPQGAMQIGDVVPLRDEFGAPRIFQPGEKIGFFLIANGYRSAANTVLNWRYGQPGIPASAPQQNAAIGRGCYTTLPRLNREASVGDGSKSQHVAMLRMPGVPGFLNGDEYTLVGFEDLNRTANSDDDFNDAVFIVRTTPETALDTSGMFRFDPNDSDGDGVSGIEDHFPSDPERAYQSRFPSSGELVIAFEDNYPQIGDADFNDAVIAFHFVTVTNAAGLVKDVLADFHLVARGASYDHTFGLHIPGLPNDATGSVEIERLVSGANGPGVRITKSLADIVADARRVAGIFESTRNALPPPPGYPFTNTFYDQPSRDAGSARLRVTFDVPVDGASLGSPPYDPYLGVKRWDDVPWDIHLPGRPGFADRPQHLPDESGDATFLDGRGYPWALLVPASWRHPMELRHVESCYGQFAEWRESGGQQRSAWYLEPTTSSGGFIAAPLLERIPVRAWTLLGPGQ